MPGNTLSLLENRHVCKLASLTISMSFCPSRAILNFKLNGKDERAILLAKMLTLDGKTPDEHKNLDHYLKTGDVIHFDCHIYDKGGGVGSGKDK